MPDMTASDSVERVVAEMRSWSSGRGNGPPPCVSDWADRLQALARGPQQAGGEDVGAAVERLRKNARNAFNASSDADTVIAAFGALQAEVARYKENDRLQMERAIRAEAALAEAREVLRLIAAPQRPDGTWNRDRSACQYLAEQILIRITSTSISSALPSSPQRAQDPGMEHAP